MTNNQLHNSNFADISSDSYNSISDNDINNNEVFINSNDFNFPNNSSTVNNPINIIKNNSYLYSKYQKIRKNMSYNPDFLARFEGFIQRKTTLPLLYDPFFKRLFNADTHKDRLTRLISCILGQDVTIVEILPTEDSQFYETFIIMDMIVRLSDGTIVNIEIQKIGSLFPGERLSCYSADTIMRQYHKLSSLNNNITNKNNTAYSSNTTKTFSYKDMKNVHTIVLLEKNSGEFISPIDAKYYFHVSRHSFNTGISLSLLSHFHIISLDTFAQYRYADVIEGNLDITKYDYDESMYKQPLNNLMLHDRLMYLSLFSISDINDVRKLINVFPELTDIFLETEEFLTRPEEVFNMFSEALKILDRNTTMLMVDEYRQEVTQMKEQIKDMNDELESKREQLSTTSEQLNATNEQLNATNKQLNAANEQLNAKDKKLADNAKQLEKAANEIAKLKALIEQNSKKQ